MGTDDDDEVTVEPRLTKGNKVPKAATDANADNLSALTLESRKRGRMQQKPQRKLRRNIFALLRDQKTSSN